MKLTTTVDGKEITRNVIPYNGSVKTLPVNKKFYVWAAPCWMCKQIHRSPIKSVRTTETEYVEIIKNNECYQAITVRIVIDDNPRAENVYIELNNCNCPEDHPHNNRGCYMGLCSCRVGM